MKIYELKIFEKENFVREDCATPLLTKYFKTHKSLEKYVGGFLKENIGYKKSDFEFLIEKIEVEE